MADQVTDEEIFQLLNLFGVEVDAAKVATLRKVGNTIASALKANRARTKVTVEVDGRPVQATVEPLDKRQTKR